MQFLNISKWNISSCISSCAAWRWRPNFNFNYTSWKNANRKHY